MTNCTYLSVRRVEWAIRVARSIGPIQLPSCRSPSPHPHVSTIHTRILFTHISIRGHISAKQYGLSFVQKAEEILVYPGIVMVLNILNTF
jgi:hypothetical protein